MLPQDLIALADPELKWTPDAGPVNWAAIFGRGAPLVVEIGTGNGVFLVAEAQRHPEIDYIGIERSNEFFTKCKKRIQREGLRNVRCLLADAHDIFSVGLTPGGVSAVICNFSDPWPKRRHRERRVFRPEFLDLVERALIPGGLLHFKTDVGWYFNLTVTLFRTRPGWRIKDAGPKIEPNAEAGAVVTNFERKAREAGSSIWGFTAVWKE